MTSNEKLGVGGVVLVTAVLAFVIGKRSTHPVPANQTPAAIDSTPALARQASASPDSVPVSPKQPSAGYWQVSEDKSPMDDSRTVSLSLDAQNPILAWPSETHTPSLILRCKERRTSLYIVNGTAPNVEYGRTDEATVRLRLDSRPAFSQYWSKSTDGDALFAPSPVTLAKQLAASKRLTYEFTPFNSNPATTTFDLSGLDLLIDKVADPCGWGAETEAAQASASRAAAAAEARVNDSIEKARAKYASTDSTLPWVTSVSGVYYYPNSSSCTAVTRVSNRATLRYFRTEADARAFGRSRSPEC